MDLSRARTVAVRRDNGLPPRGGSGFKPSAVTSTGWTVIVSLREEGVDLSCEACRLVVKALVSLREEGVDLSLCTHKKFLRRNVSLREEGVDLSLLTSTTIL